MIITVKLAWRSLWRNRRRTLITVSSIAIGTAIAVFFISMADGMYKKIVDSAVKMNAGHMTIQDPDYGSAPSIDLYVPSVEAIKKAVDGIEGIALVKTLIICRAMVATAGGSTGAAMIGVDADVEKTVSPIADHIVSGRYIRNHDERGVVVGINLAKRLKIEPGNKLVVTTNDTGGVMVSEMLRVTGIFSSGMEEADGYLVQVPLDVARRIVRLGPDMSTQVGLILKDPERTDSVIKEMETRLSGQGVAVLAWQEIMPDLASFIAVDKGSNYVFQGIIIFLIGFTILNTILMSVLERSREFATLLAIGTSPGLLRLQVLIESVFIGIIGTGLGLIIGGGISYYFQIYGIDMSSLFTEGLTITGFAVDPVIRNYLSIGLFIWLGSVVLGMTMLIGIYPAWKSSRINIPDTLRSR